MTTLAPPRLTASGQLIDTNPEVFGPLRSSADIVDNAVALRERMDEDGYLYLPGLLDRDEVLDARRAVMQKLSDEELLDPAYDFMDGVPCAGKSAGFRPDLALDNPPLMKLLYSGRMMAFYEAFFGEAVRHFDYTWMRTVGPGWGTAPHCDIVFMGRGTQALFTAWTPLGDISLEMGGLMMLEGSHRIERLKSNYGRKDVDQFCANRRGADHTGQGGGGNIRQGGVLSPRPATLRERLGGRWLTGEFQAGDLLTFGMFTVHCSLDNQSNHIRLSSDSRYQRASEPADERWIGPNPIAHGPEAKRGMIC